MSHAESIKFHVKRQLLKLRRESEKAERLAEKERQLAREARLKEKRRARRRAAGAVRSKITRRSIDEILFGKKAWDAEEEDEDERIVRMWKVRVKGQGGQGTASLFNCQPHK